MKKKLFTALACLLLLLGVGLASNWFQPNQGGGTIHFTLISLDDEVVYDATLQFESDETLFDVLNRNYSLGCGSASYSLDLTCSYRPLGGPMILKIGEVTTDWTHTYFALYQNDTYALRGVGTLTLNDLDRIVMKVVSV